MKTLLAKNAEILVTMDGERRELRNNILAWGSVQLFFMLGVLVAVVFAILSNPVLCRQRGCSGSWC